MSSVGFASRSSLLCGSSTDFHPQDWEKHSNRTGGYFQCTIYAGTTPEGGDGRDDDVPRIDLNDQFGSAVHEASRAR
jgi:hypothetical protein